MLVAEPRRSSLAPEKRPGPANDARRAWLPRPVGGPLSAHQQLEAVADFPSPGAKNYYDRGGVDSGLSGGSLMRSFIIGAVIAACLTVSGCDTMDDDDASSALSQADLAFGACQPSYLQKAQALKGHWAFVSGVDESGHTSCVWGSHADSTAEAVQATLGDCRKRSDACFIFATSDGLSDWVLKRADDQQTRHTRNTTLSRVGDSGGDDSASDDGGGGVSGDNGPSLGDFLGGLTDFLNAATGVVQATQGGGGSGGGGSVSIPSGNGYSQRGAFDDCAALYGAMGDAAGAQKCAQRSKNMETAH